MRFGRRIVWGFALGALCSAVLLWGMVARDALPVSADRPDFSAVLSAWRRATLDAFPREDRGSPPLAFPGDHGAHLTTPAEHWNVLIRLAAAERDFALRLSFARLGAAPEPARRASRWAANQFFRSFSVVTDSFAGQAHAYEHYARGVLGLGGADADPPRIRVAGNRLEWFGGAEQENRVALSLREAGFRADVQLSAVKSATTAGLTPAGKQRWQGYVLPRLAAAGVLVIENHTWLVSGDAWLSHAWGDVPPAGGQIAFDRWTLLLDDGSELALLRMQRRDGSGDASLRGLRIAPDGSTEALEPATVELQSVAGPGDDHAGWRLRVADQSLDLTLVPWLRKGEGAQGVAGSGRALYVERTGAAGRRIGWGFMEPDGV